ncbi:hypothetical protein VIGAN_05053800 [Vigna angularis var. angularis]|uniref:Uncharacterized protein n=1 Tax=Vigna angularis var. angularis TaxID=157739 RepID=A0A0S3S2Y7_PHAAN|nr:hypothetical protein VIGAN_05053800 [Vigna angularis var. angularis]
MRIISSDPAEKSCKDYQHEERQTHSSSRYTLLLGRLGNLDSTESATNAEEALLLLITKNDFDFSLINTVSPKSTGCRTSSQQLEIKFNRKEK